ncbi:acyl-CoA Delta(11) desaturase-like [Cydia amplana]|uniref:acyl-CoA Delta(11) desaturase-like n=1 Tax=Cydia amplana TaxID=1869771 RepID=UPI002FE5C091
MKEKMPLADNVELLVAEPPVPAASTAEPQQSTVRYRVVLKFAYWHLGALCGLYLAPSAHRATLVLNVVTFLAAGLGTTAGAHRLWSHRAYRAARPLQVLLVLMQTLACQHCVINWVRDHRLHHKYVDTDADPYSARRGLFFSHIGWLLLRKHPEVLRRGDMIDMADLQRNPVLQFQKKYYYPLNILLAFILPVLIPVVFWGEWWSHAHHVQLLSLMVGSHVTFCVNSLAHARGNRPYDATITPVQNTALYLLTYGEGHHNYHHAFPSDYRLSEFGMNHLNYTTALIELLARIGWAYDLKQASPEMVAKRAHRTGDGSRPCPMTAKDGLGEGRLKLK